MSFRRELANLVTPVFGPLSARHAVPDADIDRAQKRLGFTLPGVLRDYYRLAGRHRQISEGMNHILAPRALYVLNGALVFEEENQRYHFSAIRLDRLAEDDPPVAQGNRDEAAWYPESNRLSDYLLCLICWQACNVLPSACAKLSPQRLRTLKSQLQWTSFAATPKNDTLGLWGEGVCIAAFPKSREAYISGRTDICLHSFMDRFQLRGEAL